MVGTSDEDLILCHVVTAAAWDAADPALPFPASLADEFLHCCRLEQLDFVLGRHFTGAVNLRSVLFRAAEVTGEIRWEKSEPDQSPFPHLDGVIDRAAMTSVRTWPAVHE